MTFPISHARLALSLALGVLVVGCGGRSTLDNFGDEAPGLPDFNPPADGGAGDGSEGADGSMDAAAGEVFTAEGCESSDDCGGGDEVQCLVLVELAGSTLELPGGYCAPEDCSDDDDCGAGAQCLSVLGTPFCARECDGDSECRDDDGYGCTTLNASGSSDTFCLPVVEQQVNFLCNILCGDASQAVLIACTLAMDEGDDLPADCGGGGGFGGDNGGFGGNNGGFGGGDGGFSFPDGGLFGR